MRQPERVKSMARLIDADALKETLSDLECEANNEDFQSGMDFAMRDFMPTVIDAQPTAEPKRGRWIYKPAKKQKKLTNADRIRQMTDEELAELLDEDGCAECVNRPEVCDIECYYGRLAWLKQEVEQNDKR